MSAADTKSPLEAPFERTQASPSGPTRALVAPPVPPKPGPADSNPAVDEISSRDEVPSSSSLQAPLPADLLAQLVPGATIDGKYSILSILGRGGMGVVAAARHHDLGRDVALKFLCHGGGADSADELRARFRREAQINARLRNEHITRVLDVGVWRNSAYMVLERLEGADLRNRLKASGGRLPQALALSYAIQLCEGMAEAHAHGIVHRDLKPANVFVTRHPDGSDLLKIMDFGISKWRDTDIDEITKAGTVLGSPRYMAPEQLFGGKTIDCRADVWSIGAIVYQMLSGRTPYREPSLAKLCAEVLAGPPPPLQQVNPEVPPRLAAAVGRCLVRDPEERTASVAELAGSLLEAIDSPGDTLRGRLAAILAMGPSPVDDGAVNSGARRSTAITLTSISASLERRDAAPESADLAEGAATDASVVGAEALTVVPPKRGSWLSASVAGSVLVAGLLIAGAIVVRGARPQSPLAPTSAVEAAPSGVVPLPAPPPAALPAPVVDPTPSAAPSASASVFTFAPAAPARSAGAPASTGRPSSPRRPPAPASAPPRRDDDDIPSMR